MENVLGTWGAMRRRAGESGGAAAVSAASGLRQLRSINRVAAVLIIGRRRELYFTTAYADVVRVRLGGIVERLAEFCGKMAVPAPYVRCRQEGGDPAYIQVEGNEYSYRTYCEIKPEAGRASGPGQGAVARNLACLCWLCCWGLRGSWDTGFIRLCQQRTRRVGGRGQPGQSGGDHGPGLAR